MAAAPGAREWEQRVEHTRTLRPGYDGHRYEGHGLKELRVAADHVTSGTRGAVDHTQEDGPMHVFMSWARSTVANIDRNLGRAEDHFDRILLGVLVVLAVAVAFLFLQ